MCVATLHAITKACQFTPPGLKALSVIDPDDLNQQPVWFRTPNLASLNFKSGKAAYTFEADRLTARLTDRTVDTARAGDYIDYLLQARVSGISAETELFRAKMLNRRVHVAATYQNDLQRVVPYMRLMADADSGDKSNRNAYSFRGAARLLKPAPFIDASFDVIGGPYVPPDTGSSVGGVTIVEQSTSSSTFTYNVPAGKWLVGWEVGSDEDQNVSLGITSGGAELGGPVLIPENEIWTGQGNMTPTNTSFNIYFSGMAGTNTIKLWLLG